MPHISSTFLNYIDSNFEATGGKEFTQLLVEYFEFKYPKLEFGIIQHVYAPKCYIPLFRKENCRNYVELLKNGNHKKISEKKGFLHLNGLLISPLTDYTNQVKFLIVFESCPEDKEDDLSAVVREVREVFRFVSASVESNSGFINSRMVNLVGRISHDLNSLVALMPRVSAMDEALNARIKYSEALSREVLYYLRDLVIEKSNVPVTDLLSGVTSVLSIPDNVDFNLIFNDEFNSLTIDVELVDRALSAIIKNAFFATGIEGGKVKMVVEKRKNESPFIEFDWLQIIITDTGPGIPKEFLKEVKQPFFTTWKDQGHVGLGLAIAEKIIHAHNGYLDIDSKPNEGTTVFIHLPLR